MRFSNFKFQNLLKNNNLNNTKKSFHTDTIRIEKTTHQARYLQNKHLGVDNEHFQDLSDGVKKLSILAPLNQREIKALKNWKDITNSMYDILVIDSQETGKQINFAELDLIKQKLSTFDFNKFTNASIKDNAQHILSSDITMLVSGHEKTSVFDYNSHSPNFDEYLRPVQRVLHKLASHGTLTRTEELTLFGASTAIENFMRSNVMTPQNSEKLGILIDYTEDLVEKYKNYKVQEEARYLD